MARKKKSDLDNEKQIKSVNNKNSKNTRSSENTIFKNINKGELLEFQIKRLFFLWDIFQKQIL